MALHENTCRTSLCPPPGPPQPSSTSRATAVSPTQKCSCFLLVPRRFLCNQTCGYGPSEQGVFSRLPNTQQTKAVRQSCLPALPSGREQEPINRLVWKADLKGKVNGILLQGSVKSTEKAQWWHLQDGQKPSWGYSWQQWEAGSLPPLEKGAKAMRIVISSTARACRFWKSLFLAANKPCLLLH